MVKISIIVASPRGLQRCLEIIHGMQLVDCQCEECSQEFVLEYIATGWNVPATINFNYGAIAATGQYLIFVDDWVKDFYQGWQVDLIKELYKNQQCKVTIPTVQREFMYGPDNYLHILAVRRAEMFGSGILFSEEKMLTNSNKYFEQGGMGMQEKGCNLTITSPELTVERMMNRMRALPNFKILPDTAPNPEPVIAGPSARINHNVKIPEGAAA